MSLTESPLCIIGAGAMGTFFAEEFAKISATSLLVRYNQVHKSAQSEPNIPHHSKITLSELGELPEQTIFLICVKAYDLDKTLSELHPFLSPKSILVLCQNGLGIYLQAAEILRAKRPRIARLLPSFGVKKNPDGSILVSGELLASLSVPDLDRELLDIVDELLTKIGLKLNRPKNIAAAEWEKAILNLVVNPLATVLNSKNSSVIQNKELLSLTFKIAAEVRAVAAAEGFSLNQITDKDLIRKIENSAENINSTLVDIRAGKPTEIEFILGRFLRIAKGVQIHTPHLELLYLILKEREKRLNHS